MRSVAVIAAASAVAPIGDGRNDAELLAPVVDRVLAASGSGRDDVGVVCSAGSEFLTGQVGTVMGAFDAFPGWPPRTHAHLEGDGAFALHEAWIRLLAGEADVALVCAYSRPLADEPRRVLDLQLDPYLVAPLAPRPEDLAGLQATGPFTASQLCAGAAAVVLAADRDGAVVSGIEQRMDAHHLGERDLAASPSIAAASAALGLPGTVLDVLEVHAPFSHQERIVVDAIGAAEVRALTPSGGALAADPIMATGLIRIVEAANAVLRGEARRAVAHATNGPCLQHNLLCLLEAA
jgi:acetyl-CoA acetyltransferase